MRQLIRVDEDNHTAVEQSVRADKVLNPDHRSTTGDYFTRRASSDGEEPAEVLYCEWGMAAAQDVKFRGAMNGLLQSGRVKMWLRSEVTLAEVLAEEGMQMIIPPTVLPTDTR